MQIVELAAKREEIRKRILHRLGGKKASRLLYDWGFMGRDWQQPPDGPWQFWIFLAGRGAGKTRAGAEWVRLKVRTLPRHSHIGLIAPTTDSARKVMVEGESGILKCCSRYDIDSEGNGVGRPIYEPSKRRLMWANGTIATVYTAEEPERLRGPQHSALWCDELASWPRSRLKDGATEAWDNAMFGLRIGANPQAMISTTPKPIPIVRELVKMGLPRCVITRASTYANRANLASTFFSQIITKYEGTRLGRQELLGEVIEEQEGALWTRAMIDAAQTSSAPPDLTRIVVGVDPAITATATSSLCGIVIAGISTDKRAYVLADLSGRYSPDKWARVVVKAYDDYAADRIVAEGNQGGELVRINLKTVRPNLPVRIVHARHSKQARAEPVAALYEQGKVSHLKPMPELEDQLCTWVPLSGDPSPDRLDAMVWALTDLMLKGISPPKYVAPVVVGVPRYWPGSGPTDW